MWLALAALTLAALAFLVPPLLRGGRARHSRLDHDLEIYRDQLSELKADLDRGTIGAEEAAAARREIERRILRAADAGAKARVPSGRGDRATAIAIALALPAAAAALYLQLGAPGIPDQPLASRGLPAATADLPAGHEREELAALVERLAARLAEEPDDRQGWLLLGDSRRELGRFAEAAAAFGRALALEPENLGPEDAATQVAMGEALVLSADGIVTPAARLAFEKARALRPDHAGARYYLALAELQAGHNQTAYDQWLALARDTPAGAPWIPALRHRLEQTAATLGIDVGADLPPHFADTAPGPTQADVAAAAEMPPEERAAYIRAMVDRLAQRLEAEPDDAEGWLRLGRAYTVLGEATAAEDAYGNAAALRPDDARTLTLYAQALANAAGTPAEPPAQAIEVYRRILALRPEQPDALWFTGLADARAGRTEAAIAAWETLLEQIDPAAPQFAQIKTEIERLKAGAAGRGG